MQPDATNLLEIAGITTPIIGLYDVPDTAPFAPLVEPKAGVRACIFAFYKQWLEGKTLHVTADDSGCGGCGYWIFGNEHRSRGLVRRRKLDPLRKPESGRRQLGPDGLRHGRERAGSPGHRALRAAVPHPLPRRPLAGLRIRRVGPPGDLRSAVPRRNGTLDGIHGRGHPPDVDQGRS